MPKKGVPRPPPAFWNGHVLVLLPVKEVPVQSDWRGQERPEGLLEVAPRSIEESPLDQEREENVEEGDCQGGECEYQMGIADLSFNSVSGNNG